MISALSVPNVKGLTIARNALPPDLCRELAHMVREDGWTEHTSRFKRRDYGYDYDIPNRTSTKIGSGRLPYWLAAARPILREAGWSGEMADRVLATYYPDGGGLGRHVDADAFGPVIAGVTIEGEGWPLVFTRGWRTEVLHLPVGSVYVMRGEARKHWFHEVPSTGEKGTRISLTFRTGAKEEGRDAASQTDSER